MARSTLLRRFKEETGIGLTAYFMRARIRRARRLLRTTQLSLYEVRCRSGFREERSFFRAFSRLTGMTPMAYRRWYS
jgi:transcriptional regulator GlxA family with amidase domain